MREANLSGEQSFTTAISSPGESFIAVNDRSAVPCPTMRPALIRCLNPWLVILAVGLFGNALISASVELPWWAVGAAWTVFGACMGMAYADAYETRADRTRSADARLSAALDRIGSALAPEYDEAQRRARLVIRRG